MRDLSIKADNVGDTLPAGDFNANIRNELQNVVESADFTLDPEGGADTNLNMLSQAIALYSNAGWYYQESGAADAYVLSRVGNLKSVASYKDGMIVAFVAGNANTGASTINVDSIGVKDLTAEGGGALTGGEIIADYVIARYHLSGDRFEIVYSAIASQEASTTVKGIIELATQAEVDAGTDAVRAIVPATLREHPGVAKAWVYFDGTGTIAINDDYNVSSLTDHDVGKFTINYTVSLPSTDYAIFLSTENGLALGADSTTPRATASTRIRVVDFDNIPFDDDNISFAALTN